MSVIEKINTLTIDNVGEIEVVIFSNMCQIGESAAEPIIKIIKNKTPLIEIVFEVVTKFLQWYNTQK